MVTELGVDRAGVAAAVLENTRMMYEYSHGGLHVSTRCLDGMRWLA